MPTVENNLMLMTVVSDTRSLSTSSPSKEIKGIKLFRAIGRKLARRSAEDLNFNEDQDSRSSSTDSCSSSNSTNRDSRGRKGNSGDSGFRSVSPNHMSSNSSEAGSDVPTSRRHHHSTSAESLRKMFESLNLSARSQSCNNTKEKRKTKKQEPKRILRQPVAYTYVKGLSGLPTQRIPKNTKMYNSCSCGMQYVSGLNR